MTCWREGLCRTLNEGLFEGLGDAEEVPSLIDTVGPGLRPRSRRQEVEQVAEVVEWVRHPRPALVVPPYEEDAERRTCRRTHTHTHTNIHPLVMSVA